MFSSKRLKELRLEHHLTQVEVAKALGIAKMSYSTWESGKTKPNQANLVALADYFNVPKTYFESEHNIVTNFLQLNENNQAKAEAYVEDLLIEQNKVVELFPIEVAKNITLAAGPGYGFDDEFETETVYIDEELYGYDIACWIEGNSMSPTYLNGEVALIRETGFDYDGGVYALVWNGLTYIKKLYREEDGVRMVSINKKGNPDRFIPYDDDFHIVGKVVGHFMPVEVDF